MVNHEKEACKRLTLISLKGYECALLPGSKQQREKVRFHLERRSDGQEAPASSKTVLLINTLFSYLYQTADPLNQTGFRINLSDFGAYAGICMDRSQRASFLAQYREMTEIWWVEKGDDGIQSGQLFTKLELLPDGVNLYLETTYFSRILTEIFVHVNADHKQQIMTLWHTPLVSTSICGARDTNAALAVLILSVLIAQRGTKETKMEISLRELTERIPELDSWIRNSERELKLRNRKLRRWLDRFTGQLRAGDYFEQYTVLFERYSECKICRYFGKDGKAKNPSLLQLVNTCNKILISHGQYIPLDRQEIPESKIPDYSDRGYIPKAEYDRLSNRQQVKTLKYFLRSFLLKLGGDITESRDFCCILPGHEDHNPSMRYYQSGELKPYPTVHCFGCEFDGDLFDLIEKLNGVDFTHARQIAEGMFVNDDSNKKEENKNGVQ